MSAKLNKKDRSAHRNIQYFVLWAIFGWIMIATVIFFALITNPPKNFDFSSADKLVHLFAYCVLMGWFSQLYTSIRSQILWALVFCLMGILLEFIQGWGGHRFFEYADMAANAAGVFLGWWLSRTLCAGWLVRIDQVLSRQ